MPQVVADVNHTFVLVGGRATWQRLGPLTNSTSFSTPAGERQVFDYDKVWALDAENGE